MTWLWHRRLRRSGQRDAGADEVGSGVMSLTAEARGQGHARFTFTLLCVPMQGPKDAATRFCPMSVFGRTDRPSLRQAKPQYCLHVSCDDCAKVESPTTGIGITN